MLDNSADQRLSPTDDDRIWKKTGFRRLWAGQATSLLGDQCYRIGLIWFLANSDHGARSTTLLAVAMALPVALFGVFAGAMADRFDRARVLIGTDVARAGLSLVIAIALPYAETSVAIYAFSSLLVLLGLAFNPAVQASLPRIVGQSRSALVAADSWLIGTIMVASTAGPALAGALYTLDASRLIMFNSISFAISAALLYSIRGDLRSRTERTRTRWRKAWREVARRAGEGAKYVRGDPVLRPQFVVFPVMETLLYSTVFILPVYLVDRNLGSGVFGLLTGVWMAGRVAGLAVLKRSALQQRRGVIFGGNFLVQGVCVLAAMTWPSITIMAVALFMAGLPSGAAQVAMSTYVQSQVPDERRGVVFGTLGSRVMWLMPVGPVLIGALAEQTGARSAIVLCGAGLLMGGVVLVTRKAVVAVR